MLNYKNTLSWCTSTIFFSVPALYFSRALLFNCWRRILEQISVNVHFTSGTVILRAKWSNILNNKLRKRTDKYKSKELKTMNFSKIIKVRYIMFLSQYFCYHNLSVFIQRSMWANAYMYIVLYIDAIWINSVKSFL